MGLLCGIVNCVTIMEKKKKEKDLRESEKKVFFFGCAQFRACGIDLGLIYYGKRSFYLGVRRSREYKVLCTCVSYLMPFFLYLKVCLTLTWILPEFVAFIASSCFDDSFHTLFLCLPSSLILASL